MIEFKRDKQSHIIIRAYGLEAIAAESGDCYLDFSFDGAKLTMNACHYTCGLKLLDSRAVDPWTGSHTSTFVHHNFTFKSQSSDNCFVSQNSLWSWIGGIALKLLWRWL